MRSFYVLTEKLQPSELNHELDLSDFSDDWDELLSNEGLTISLNTTYPNHVKDLFSLAGTIGVASSNLTSVLSGWAGPRLKTRSALVDGFSFNILLAGEPMDALDRERSRYTVFNTSPTRIKELHKIVFRSEAIPFSPFIFTIPESEATLFLNEKAAELLRQQEFKGVDLVNLANYQE